MDIVWFSSAPAWARLVKRAVIVRQRRVEAASLARGCRQVCTMRSARAGSARFDKDLCAAVRRARGSGLNR